jgi:pimeloyl-ACP methyl ester carboxylesterase
MLNIAPLLTDVFGSGVNLISFEPRGVNNTGPALDCFPNDPATKAIFEPQYYRIIANTPDNIASQFYLAESFGQWCNSVIGGPNGTARYVNTPAVAHGMLAFAELAHATRGKPNADAKLGFAGFSYGRVLGATFSTMFPDCIGRFILDGVVDGEDYYEGSWSKSLIDTDKVVDGLISSCLAAGKEACPLYEDSFEAIEYRLSNILTKLKQHSIPVWDPAVVDVPALATYADWSNVLLLATNFPLASYPKNSSDSHRFGTGTRRIVDSFEEDSSRRPLQ